TKDVGKGTGQGLSMAYSVIVEKHNGKIEVESEVNVGTQFKISLPIS
ncbi:ATP-binding protein, partial [Paraglaciecola sp.]